MDDQLLGRLHHLHHARTHWLIAAEALNSYHHLATFNVTTRALGVPEDPLVSADIPVHVDGLRKGEPITVLAAPKRHVRLDAVQSLARHSSSGVNVHQGSVWILLGNRHDERLLRLVAEGRPGLVS